MVPLCTSWPRPFAEFFKHCFFRDIGKYSFPNRVIDIRNQLPEDIVTCTPVNSFWTTVCKTVRPMLTDCCLSCPVLSVTLIYCGQTVEWIKMPLGMEVGLGPGHNVLDGDPAPFRKGDISLPTFGPCLLWPNGWIDQDATWYGGRPRPRRHCVR